MKSNKKIALFDIDDTIYNGGIIFPLMESQVKNNLLPKKYIDEVYEYKALYEKGELQYEELSRKVVIAWAQGLKSISYIEVVRLAKEFIKRDSNKFYSYTKKLLDLLRKTYDTVIITNEPQFVAEPVLKLFGFTNYISTIFEVQNGVLTGNVSRFNSTQTDKKKSIHEVFTNYVHDQSFAFGDSVGDIGMFEEVDYPICVNASSELQEIAQKNNWPLTDYNSILNTVSKILTGKKSREH